METRIIELTEAAFKHGNLNLRPCGKEFFPEDVFGGSSRKAGLGKQITIQADGLAIPIATDIPTDKETGKPRWLFRDRKWLKDFMDCHGLKPGDSVTIRRTSTSTYQIVPNRHARQLQSCAVSENLSPIEYANRLATQYLTASLTEHRKSRGQYFTPPEVATFMAHLAMDSNNKPHRILDPGGGLGILSCAVCEELAQRNCVQRIEIDTYENDPDLTRLLRESLSHTTQWLANRGIQLKADVFEEDFVVSTQNQIFRLRSQPYDLIISNPPYQKIAARDPRALALDEVVHGQPNLYALFMAASANLLGKGGIMVFITPRSFATGHYFRAFRRTFFAQMKPIRIHLFGSRNDVFSAQSVLQENVIIKAQKSSIKRTTVISYTRDSANLYAARLNRVPLSYALRTDDKDIILRLPIDEIDDLVIEVTDSWTNRLLDHDIQISTGPLIPFRAKSLLCRNAQSNGNRFVPLIWMRNVQPMQVIWPCNGNQNRGSTCQYVLDSTESRNRKLVLPNRNVVLLRRFSAKEQKRRLTAAPLLRGQLPYEFVGIENHVNYIYRPGSELDRHECLGLAAILNSTLLDKYFRIYSGNTQVSASEIRAMPIPPWEMIRSLGHLVDKSPGPTLEEIDAIVWKIADHVTKRKRPLVRLMS